LDAVTPLTMIPFIAASALLYIFIGILPGTDETATMAPIALALLMAGVDPLIVFAWFMAAIAVFEMADSVPVALAGIPGGVMAVPQVPDALIAKESGYADTILRKGLSASILGQLTGLAVALSVSYFMMPLQSWFSAVDKVLGVNVARWFWILFAGTIILAAMSRNKAAALLAIPAFAILVQGLRSLYGRPVTVSIFLGITVGPLIYDIFSVLHRELRKSYERRGLMKVKLAKVERIELNPLKNLTREEIVHSTIWSSVTSVLATFMSPVGLTTLIGDLLRESKKDRVKGALLAYTVRDAIKNATYIGGTIVPLLVIGQPTGPMSAGPAAPFFQKIEALGMTPRDYMVSHYGYTTIALVAVASSAIAFLIAYPILVKYSRRLTLALFRNVPAEALYAVFISIVLALAYYDAGLRGVFGTIIVSLVSGVLWRLGVSLGVLFMTLVAAPTIVALISAIA